MSTCIRPSRNGQIILRNDMDHGSGAAALLGGEVNEDPNLPVEDLGTARRMTERTALVQNTLWIRDESPLPSPDWLNGSGSPHSRVYAWQRQFATVVGQTWNRWAISTYVPSLRSTQSEWVRT